MKRALLFLFWVCLGSIGSYSTAAEPVPPRFVFLIDTSAAMGHKQPSTLRTIRVLVGSGFDGQIKSGETFAIWTFTDSLHNDLFPPQRWMAQDSKLLAEVAAQMILSEPHHARGDLAGAFRQAVQALTKTSEVTLIVISDRPLQGTPFDHEIAHFYARQNAQISGGKKAIVTCFAFDGGLPVSFTTAITGGSVELPRPATIAQNDTPAIVQPPAQPKEPAEPRSMNPETNASPATASAVEPVPDLERPQPPISQPEKPKAGPTKKPEQPKTSEVTSASEKLADPKTGAPSSAIAPASNSLPPQVEKKELEPQMAEIEKTNLVSENSAIAQIVAPKPLFSVANLAIFAGALGVFAWIIKRMVMRPSARESRSIISRSMDPPK